MAMTFPVDLVDTLQEVDLSSAQFSDVTVNGEELEVVSSSVKTEVSEGQSEAKMDDKSAATVSPKQTSQWYERATSLCTQNMSLPLTARHCREPDEQDKLSPDEIEALVLEVMKTYQDPEVTKDPYMSPLLAPADMLTGLPTAHIIVSDC